MKLADLLASFDKIVAFGGFASAAALLGLVVEKGYQDAIGFDIHIDNKAYADSFRDFLTQSGPILLAGLTSRAALLIPLVLILYLVMPSSVLKKLQSRVRRGTISWVAPPALLCLSTTFLFYPATKVHNLLDAAFAPTPFQLDTARNSVSSLLDMVVCAEAPAVSSRPLLIQINAYCATRGYRQPSVARNRIESQFRWLWLACALCLGLYVFARWSANGTDQAKEQDGPNVARIRLLTVLAAAALTMDIFGLCVFYGKVVRLKPVEDATLWFQNSNNADPLPCGPGAASYRNVLILAQTDKDIAVLCYETLRTESISKAEVQRIEPSGAAVAPLTLAMQRRADWK